MAEAVRGGGPAFLFVPLSSPLALWALEVTSGSVIQWKVLNYGRFSDFEQIA